MRRGRRRTHRQRIWVSCAVALAAALPFVAAPPVWGAERIRITEVSSDVEKHPELDPDQVYVEVRGEPGDAVNLTFATVGPERSCPLKVPRSAELPSRVFGLPDLRENFDLVRARRSQRQHGRTRVCAYLTDLDDRVLAHDGAVARLAGAAAKDGGLDDEAVSEFAAVIVLLFVLGLLFTLAVGGALVVRLLRRRGPFSRATWPQRHSAVEAPARSRRAAVFPYRPRQDQLVDEALISTIGITDHALEQFVERAQPGPGVPDKHSIMRSPVARDAVERILMDCMLTEGRVTYVRPRWSRSSSPADWYVQIGEFLLCIVVWDEDRGNWAVLTVVNGVSWKTWSVAFERGWTQMPVPYGPTPPPS